MIEHGGGGDSSYYITLLLFAYIHRLFYFNFIIYLKIIANDDAPTILHVMLKAATYCYMYSLK